MDASEAALKPPHAPLSGTGQNSVPYYEPDPMDTAAGASQRGQDADDFRDLMEVLTDDLLTDDLFPNTSNSDMRGQRDGIMEQILHDVEGSDNDRDNYNDHDVSGAAEGIERRSMLTGPARKRKKDTAAKSASSLGDGTSEAEKAKASRDRNREHARNTRIRKKQYLENLKMQIGEMLQAKAREERDIVLDQSRQAAVRMTQRQIVLNVFFLRATEDLSRESWASVIDSEFECITPVTPYRSFLPSEVKEFRRIIKGVDGMIQDTASLAVFMQSISRRSHNPTGKQIRYQFYTSPDDTVVGKNTLMSRWLMKTENAMDCGAQCEVFSHGMLKAQFAPDNRIKKLELEFDVMSFMQQLQRALGGGEFRVIPNTLDAALQPSRHARVVCSADHPYWITNVNEAWSSLMGHTEQQAKLFTISLLDGPPVAKNGGELDAFVHSCMGSSPIRAGKAELSVIARDMRRLQAALQLYPLGTAEGAITHFVVIMEEVPTCMGLPPPGMDLFPFV